MSTEKTPDAGPLQDGNDKPDLDTGMDTVGVEAPATAQARAPADPAKAEGSEAEQALAFADTFRMLHQRISIFVSLPLDRLSKLSLQQHLDEIGQSKPTAQKESA